MKRLLPILLLLAATFRIDGQITVEASTFPVPGDTLLTATDNMPGDIDLIGPGGPHVWDFSFLQSPFTRRVLIREAAEGENAAAFPTADFVAEIPGAGEGYFRTGSDRVELLGISGRAIEGLELDLLVAFDNPSVEKWAPLNYPEERTHSFSFQVALPASAVADLIPDSIPIVFDSIRLRLLVDRTYEIDAWGTVILPEGPFEVLREQRTEVATPSIEVKVPVLEWVPIDDLLPDTELLRPDTSLTYFFFNDLEKTPIAAVAMDSTRQQVASVEYRSSGVISRVRDLGDLQPGVYAYPNPAITQIRFDFTNLRPGNYRLTIYNVLGQPLWKNNYRINGESTVKVDLARFKKGTYLYSLEDERGKVLNARRFVILRP